MYHCYKEIRIKYLIKLNTSSNLNRIEPQIIDYQTQQYRLFPGLATTFANLFSTLNFRNIINLFQQKSDNFKKINTEELAKVFI